MMNNTFRIDYLKDLEIKFNNKLNKKYNEEYYARFSFHIPDNENENIVFIIILFNNKGNIIEKSYYSRKFFQEEYIVSFDNMFKDQINIIENLKNKNENIKYEYKEQVINGNGNELFNISFKELNNNLNNIVKELKNINIMLNVKRW